MEKHRFYLISKHPITHRTCKIECPVCHHKKRFSPYWDSYTQSIVDGAGMCDRVNGCGAHIRPSDVMGKDSAGVADSARIAMQMAKQTAMRDEPAEMRLFALNGVFRLWRVQYIPAGLITWLTALFGLQNAMRVLDLYNVTGDGTSDGVCFWQSNGKGIVSTGRIMHYLSNGHRNKNKQSTWAHSVCQKAGKLPADYQPQKFPFGLHLCKRGARVLMVESEKSALLCSLYNLTHPNNDLCSSYDVIMATGGANMLNATTSSSAPIFAACGASLTLCPDDDAAGRSWRGMAQQAGWKIYDVAHTMAPHGKENEGYDIGDIIADRMTNEIDYMSIEH